MRSLRQPRCAAHTATVSAHWYLSATLKLVDSLASRIQDLAKASKRKTHGSFASSPGRLISSGVLFLELFWKILSKLGSLSSHTSFFVHWDRNARKQIRTMRMTPNPENPSLGGRNYLSGKLAKTIYIYLATCSPREFPWMLSSRSSVTHSGFGWSLQTRRMLDIVAPVGRGCIS